MAEARHRSRFVDEAVGDYAAAHSTPADEVLLGLRRVTAERTGAYAGMQIGDDQAVLMEMLARAMGATRAVEVGTFTGTSALAVARGLGPGGHLLCCDVSEEWTALARDAWARAGVADRIELRIGPALDTLRALPDDTTFDLAFVDADKPAYVDYYEELVPRLRPGGLLLADNTLQGGAVVDPAADQPNVAAIRRFNDHVLADPRVQVVLLAVGDGLTLVQRRP